MKTIPSLMRLVGIGLAGALSLSLAHAQSADFRLGSAIDAAQAERSITIAADTRWANVAQGETIRFVSGPNVFGWKFDGTLSAVDLSKVAPAGFLGRPFVVYVKREYRGPAAN